MRFFSNVIHPKGFSSDISYWSFRRGIDQIMRSIYLICVFVCLVLVSVPATSKMGRGRDLLKNANKW